MFHQVTAEFISQWRIECTVVQARGMAWKTIPLHSAMNISIKTATSSIIQKLI
jgi:hypothetical protein